MSSSSSASSSPSKEIFVLSEASSIKLGGNCYKKVPGVFGVETHNVSSITDEYLNCQICEGDLKTVDVNNNITVNKHDECVIVNLLDTETSQINIYNGKTTTSHKIKNTSGKLILDYDQSTSYSFSNANQIEYIDINLLTYRVEYKEDSTNKYLCFLEDPFRERCNKKIGIEYKSFNTKTFQKINITLYEQTSERKKFTFHVGGNLDLSLKEIEDFFHDSYTSSAIDIKLKLNPLNNNLMFWKPFGSQIEDSDIIFSTQNYTINESYTNINLSDRDFDGIIDSEDPYPYGGTYSEKAVFKSEDINLKNFNFGDSIYLEVSPSKKNTYVTQNFQTIAEAFGGLSSKLNSDYENNLNNLYSRVYFDSAINSTILEVWDPCSLLAPTQSELSLIKTAITVNSENYFSNSSYTTNMDGPYEPDGGSFTLLSTPITPTSTSTPNSFSGKYFISNSTHNSKPIYKNTLNDYSIIWDTTNSIWKLSKNLSFSNIELITFGSLEKPSSLQVSTSLYNTNITTFKAGLNDYPTYSNNKGYYIFKHSLGSWFLTDARYGISSSSKHTSESTIC